MKSLMTFSFFHGPDEVGYDYLMQGANFSKFSLKCGEFGKQKNRVNFFSRLI